VNYFVGGREWLEMKKITASYKEGIKINAVSGTLTEIVVQRCYWIGPIMFL
jgi:hypothetical protein